MGAGQLAWWLRALVALLEEPGSTASTDMVVHNHLKTLVPEDPMLSSELCGHGGRPIVHTHTCNQNTYVYVNLSKIFKYRNN